MKKFTNKNFAYGGVVLLAGAMTFSACSSDEEVVNVNPSYDGKSVKTQFAINVPRAAQVKTRMTGDNTQADGTGFLGMQDIRLIPFSETIGENTSLGQVITLSNIEDGITGTASSKIYKNVAIPTGTTNFLFYGQALRSVSATNEDNGILTATVDGQTSTAGITFKLNDVNTTGSILNTNSEALLTVLNNVVEAAGWSSSTDVNLKQLYEDFTKSQAGSANSILCTMQALYDNLKDNTDDVSNAIKAAITQNGTFTNTDGKLSTENKYPADLNLPDGAVAVEFNKNNDNKFTYIVPTGDATSNPIIDVNNITYPASLYYWTSTPLYASGTAVADGDWPSTPSEWEEATAFSGWGTEVTSSTQSVALKNNINYGVGNLALTVTCAAATLQDHEKTQADGITSQRNVNVPTDGFPVSAVLVGNQPAVVGYDFAAVATDGFYKTIYDSKCSLNAKYNSVSEANYTLVLPTKNMANQVVSFVLELTNNSDTEFCGHNEQIIPIGGKFYLIGTLNVNAGNGVVNPDNLNEVFISDYLTKANVKITSLENAYNVIPDLRSTNLQLGLSVDLDWEQGIIFDVEVGK